MKELWQKSLFVVGTGTDVGKTYVSCLIARQLSTQGVQVGVYKPVASGCVERDGQLISHDAEQLWIAAGKPQSLEEVTPQLFAAPLAPNVAARQANQTVDSAQLRTGLESWREREFLLVEGVGGLMSPVSDDELVLDLAIEFDLPLLLVIANRLGCINDTLLSLSVAEQRGLRVARLVLNDVHPSGDESQDSNQSEIERISGRRVTRVPFEATDVDLTWLGQQSELPE